MPEQRTGDWGCTYTGRRYWPEDPRPEDIHPHDIAHALALQCRFGGHVRRFYSVAQHSVLVSHICDPADALWGLLHDASEAYLVDIPRPVKRAPGMSGYMEYEDRMMRAICDALQLPHEMPESVRKADEVLLATEARDLMPAESVKDWTLIEAPLEGVIEPWSPDLAKVLWLHRLDELLGQQIEQDANELLELLQGAR